MAGRQAGRQPNIFCLHQKVFFKRPQRSELWELTLVSPASRTCYLTEEEEVSVIYSANLSFTTAHANVARFLEYNARPKHKKKKIISDCNVLFQRVS